MEYIKSFNWPSFFGQCIRVGTGQLGTLIKTNTLECKQTQLQLKPKTATVKHQIMQNNSIFTAISGHLPLLQLPPFFVYIFLFIF